MNATVFPIAVTMPNWKALSEVVSRILDRNIILMLDRANIKPEGLAPFVSVLGEFQEQGQNPIQTQRNAGNLLRHVMISMAVSATKETLFEAAMNGPIAILDSDIETFVIMSGSLQEWKTLILNLCNPRTLISGRNLGTEILKALDGLGLSSIFDSYSRKVDQSGYLLLTQK